MTQANQRELEKEQAMTGDQATYLSGALIPKDLEHLWQDDSHKIENHGNISMPLNTQNESLNDYMQQLFVSNEQQLKSQREMLGQDEEVKDSRKRFTDGAM